MSDPSQEAKRQQVGEMDRLMDAAVVAIESAVRDNCASLIVSRLVGEAYIKGLNAGIRSVTDGC